MYKLINKLTQTDVSPTLSQPLECEHQTIIIIFIIKTEYPKWNMQISIQKNYIRTKNKYK
jgi:hypothetical protein